MIATTLQTRQTKRGNVPWPPSFDTRVFNPEIADFGSVMPKQRRRATHGHLAIPHTRSSSATGSIRRSEEEAVGPCRTKPLATPQGQKLRIPASITAVINSWAPVAMKNCREQAAKHGLPSPRPDQIMTIGTDCSGLDAPILAMKVLGFRVEHAFSSEVVDWKREFIRLNSSPKTVIFDNMLRRDRASFPACDIYCCGFSCKPFSSLHNRRRFFRESEAKAFFETSRTIRALRPPRAILENVDGIRKVMPRVVKELKGAGSYAIIVCHIDPRDSGEPVSRPRTYFVLVRLDVLIVPQEKIQAVVASMLGSGGVAEPVPVERRLLPEGYDLLSRITPAKPRSKTQPRGSKLLAAMRTVPRVALRPIAGLSARAAATLEACVADMGMRDVPHQNIDVSQSRGRCRFTEFVPTITPGAKIVIGSRRRLLHPIEMLLLCGVPVGELTWPSSFEGRHFQDMAGNSMHCMSAGCLAERDTADRRGHRS